MIIIVEGIDRVGKTTLCNKLSAELNIPIFKQERFNDDTGLLSCGNILGLVNFWNFYKDVNVIVDRFHWTEAVYSALNRDNYLPYQYIKQIEQAMLANIDNYFIVQVMPTDIEWSNKQHGSDLSRHQDLFNTLYDACTLNKIRCDHLTFEHVLSKIERMLKYGSQ